MSELRYQPADREHNGRLMYGLVDVKKNKTMPWWYETEDKRRDALDALNKWDAHKRGQK